MDWGSLAGAAVGPLISTAGSLWSGHQNRKSQKSANNMMVYLANTAHQREVADLEAAGLNPILSATGGNGAGVPSIGTLDYDNATSSFGSSAQALSKAMSKNQDLQNNKLQAEAVTQVATAKNLEAQNKNLQAQNEELRARVRNIDADTDLKRAQTGSRTVFGGMYHDAKDFLTHEVGGLTDKATLPIRNALNRYDAQRIRDYYYTVRDPHSARHFEKKVTTPVESFIREKKGFDGLEPMYFMSTTKQKGKK